MSEQPRPAASTDEHSFLLSVEEADRQALAASGIVSAFKHLWFESWGPRLEHWLFQGVASLLATQRSTLIDLPRLFTDDAFRESVIVFRVGSADAELLAPEFHPISPDEISDQAPFWAWLRRGVGHRRIKASPRMFPARNRLEAVRAQSRRNFGRPGAEIERSFR
jgi:hypothetical protein